MNILETNLHVFSPFSNAQVKIYTVVSQGLLIQYFITMEFTFYFLFTHFSFHRDEIRELKGVIVSSIMLHQTLILSIYI